MKRKLSRQALRSRRLLKGALVELIQEQPYESIRVEDITNRADLGRATFYMHYKDKDELLTKIIDGFYDAMEKELEAGSLSDGLMGLENTLRHAQEEPAFYRIVLSHGVSLERLRGLMVARITERLGEFSAGTNLELTVHFLAGGLLGTLRWWIDNLETVSAETIRLHIQRLIAQGIPATITA